MVYYLDEFILPLPALYYRSIVIILNSPRSSQFSLLQPNDRLPVAVDDRCFILIFRAEWIKMLRNYIHH